MAGISAEIDAMVEIDTKLDDLKKILEERARQDRQTPRYLHLPFQFSVGSSSDYLYGMDLGGPLQGRHWFVNRIAANTKLGTTAPTSIGGFYLGTGTSGQAGTVINWANDGAANAPFLSTSAEFIESSLPVSESWGRDQFVLHFPEHIWVAVYQVSSATSFTLAGRMQVTDVGEHEDPGYRNFDQGGPRNGAAR